MTTLHKPLAPDATIGILGGGQLGRMLAQAAHELGFRVHIYSDKKDSCAFDVAKLSTCAPYDNWARLADFLNTVDAVTYEFENIPAETAAFIAARKPLFPNADVLATTQDRVKEKRFVNSLKIATAPFAPVNSSTELSMAFAKIGMPAILKTARLGYDGKGQVKLDKGDDLGTAWRSIGEQPAVLEGFVKFEREISVVIARDASGKTAAFDPAANVHRNHILHTSTVPAKITPALAKEAVNIATKIAKALNYVGVLAVELFVVKKGAKRELLVNEIAPRVHNSGHWTMDGAQASQFEQHIRAVAGWPLNSAKRVGKSAVMTNLIGDEVLGWEKIAKEPGASVHLYGKGAAKAGRKMGHVTRVKL
ncbi:MAG TPA: 5-(carboxyamino)imidazole ribonucleotide synthase [Xanthobacteraceae bacterium]|nr:5-(carboxyamino)imidazole ribonucleotide synthase [Xanthobacteraceae bacterium]